MKTAQSRLKSGSACDNLAKASGKLLLYFVQKSEEGSLKIANTELIIAESDQSRELR
jgi:hypothetical protein